MNVLAVVPAYKEPDTIGDTVRALMSVPLVDRVVVVDDASNDETPRKAVEAGATIVINGRNMGKGGSLARVLEKLDFEVLILIDGDIGVHAAESSVLLEPIRKGEVDLTVAVFPKAKKKGGFGLVKGLGRCGIKCMTGFETRSPLSGQRAMTRSVYESASPFDGGFGLEVGMTIDALKAGYRIKEVDTSMSHRETGRDFNGFIHRGRQFVHVVVALIKRAGMQKRQV